MIDGRLRPCPTSPNCVCSERPDQPEFEQPLVFSGPPEKAWRTAAAAVTSIGGSIAEDNGTYLHAIFVSKFFQFKDDLELRLDTEHSLIQFRSASRIGYSDLGVNLKRINRLRNEFDSLSNAINPAR